MAEDKKKVNPNEVKETEEKEISLEKLDKVVGGGAFSNIPRVPTQTIDETVKEKI
ncbi:MAG: hypothetical protein IKU13_09950 [Clostridia bacterium]|nr:hypothetical protein [Clostridia bacterium]